MRRKLTSNKNSMSRRVFVRTSALSSAGLATILAGCGDDDARDPDPGPSSTASQGTPSLGATPARLTRADYARMNEAEFYASLPNMPPKDFDDKDIKTSGTFRRMILAARPFDFHTITPLGSTIEMVGGVYNRLIRLSNAAGALTRDSDIVFEGDLATHWEQPDPQTLIVTLNQDILWQDVAPLNGRKFTADDIRYSFNRGATITSAIHKAHLSQFTSIEDIGNNQLRLRLSAPNPAGLMLLAAPFAYIMPREIGDDLDKAKTEAVGTGGMIMRKFTPNVEIVYEKNPNYFKNDSQGRSKPYIDGYTVSVVSDTANQMAQIEAGNIDFPNNASSPITTDNAFEFAKRVDGWVIQAFSNLFPSAAIVGRYQAPPWNDLRFRLALNALIDRKSINASFYKNLGTDGPYFPFNAVFDAKPMLEDLGPNYQFDPARARQLLRAAGYEDYSINLNYFPSQPLVQEQIEAIAGTAAAGGIKLNLMRVPDAAANNQLLASKSWSGLILVSHGIDFPDAMAALPSFLPGSGTNFGDINNPRYAEIYEKQRRLDGASRRIALKEAYDLLIEDVPEANLTQRPIITIWKDRLTNYRDASWGPTNGGLGAGQWDSVWVS